MTDLTLQFVIMVDGHTTVNNLIRIIMGSFDEVKIVTANSCDLRGNWIEITKNEGADPSKKDDPLIGYLDFPWQVQSTPMNKNVTEANQIELARQLQDLFRHKGYESVVAANFEDKL